MNQDPMPEQNSPLPNFESPPVNEVVFGVGVEPIKGLLITHLGAFWTRVRETYPVVEHAPPLATGSELLWVDEATKMPLPRVWLVSESGQELIQIQSDRFLFNWRQTEQTQKYPRYPKLRDQFQFVYAAWEEFIREEMAAAVRVTTYELSYINVIPRREGWESVERLDKLFRDFQWNPSKHDFLPPPNRVTWNATFPIANDSGQLIVRMSPATRTADKADVIRLELLARSERVAGQDAARWFDVAREWIVRGFADLTQEEVQQQVWKKIKEPAQ